MIDTHCHIDLYPNPLAVATEAERELTDVVAVTYLPSHFALAQQHLKGFKYVRPALGLHPLAWKDHSKEVAKFVAMAKDAYLIGEIGLDFSYGGRSGRTVQEQSLAAILPSIADRPRFITLHSRGAEDEVLSHLKEAGVRNAVFHWFSGSKAQLTKVFDAGHLISVNTAMIRTTKWAELIRLVPRNAILTETDGPFVCRGKIPDKPSSVADVLEWLATQWRCNRENVEDSITQNYSRIFEVTGSGGKN